MKIALASDHPDHDAVPAVAGALRALGHEVLVPEAHGSDWVQVGQEVARMVAGRQARLGVVCCWTGTGVSIAANKIDGVRAALCADEETAEQARLYNHANVLALALSRHTPQQAAAIVTRWVRTPTGSGEHRARIERLEPARAVGAGS